MTQSSMEKTHWTSHPKGWIRSVTAVAIAAFALLGSSVRADDLSSIELQRPLGGTTTLGEYQKEKARPVVLCFLGVECPLAKLYAPELSKLANEYQKRGVTLLGIDSNVQDSLLDIAGYSREHSLTFPLLKDPGHRLADALNAKRTPEVVVLDGDRTVRYRGRVDDRYGIGYIRDEPKRRDLKVALEELLAGKEVSTPETEAIGCFIGRRREPKPDSDVTFHHQITRIFQRRCVECHRDGDIAPFELTNYEEVAGWAETIAEVVNEQRMPPWHANPQHGSFANARLMTAKEKELVNRWVENGAPEGDPKKAPSPRDFVDGWKLPREPDLVLAMRDKPFVVPAEGVVDYQYYAIDPGFTEDKWVCAADIVPGNRAVVHHAIIFISPPEENRKRGLGFLAGYVPGQGQWRLEPGQARFVPAGSKLIFQMHYTPVGSVQEDLTKIGLCFVDDDQVSEELITLFAAESKFEIPPHAGDHEVTKVYTRFPKEGRLLAMSPHMHLRGKSFRFIAHHPDGSSEIMLDIPNYDFNWQNNYVLSQPIDTDEGFQVECVATFDNSVENPNNPDPAAPVRWGEQTWEEMMIGFFEVAVPKGTVEKMWAKRKRTKKPEDLAKVEQIAEQLMKRHDHNGDGVIRRHEVPEAFALFAFKRFDRDRDGSITLEEARALAKRKLN
ncbi:thiol-disulfide oxidoreductase [Planctomycetes bacterium Pan216]|uniref:Thiol-disulfide oxidoreductase n=1 Tax=Kolteria novifilia TaxID=2527975 RepID=A0A518B8P5_9BACT|nr:thiol-disulfide oxidoreductase [Planctomycetes bacterium Pan216]